MITLESIVESDHFILCSVTNCIGQRMREVNLVPKLPQNIHHNWDVKSEVFLHWWTYKAVWNVITLYIKPVYCNVTMGISRHWRRSPSQLDWGNRLSKQHKSCVIPCHTYDAAEKTECLHASQWSFRVGSVLIRWNSELDTHWVWSCYLLQSGNSHTCCSWPLFAHARPSHLLYTVNHRNLIVRQQVWLLEI